MQGPYRAGDIVGVDHMGRQFLALVKEEASGGTLKVDPLTYGITFYTVKKREVKVIYRKARGQTPIPKPSGGVAFI